MSHIVTIQTQVRDPAAIAAACERLKLPQPVQGTFRLFTTVTTGLGVELPGWRFPVVCQTDTGELNYDNYQGRWGDPHHLDSWIQSYAVEKSSRPQCPRINGCFY